MSYTICNLISNQLAVLMVGRCHFFHCLGGDPWASRHLYSVIVALASGHQPPPKKTSDRIRTQDLRSIAEFQPREPRRPVIKEGSIQLMHKPGQMKPPHNKLVVNALAVNVHCFYPGKWHLFFIYCTNIIGREIIQQSRLDT